jgi:PPOX class probable F420-dependent enzyme
MTTFTREQLAFLQEQRLGHLATADDAGQPHVVPVCYVCDGQSLYIALDAKPKRVASQQLKRVRNILQNPHVALVVDRYSEDWSRLAYVLIQGTAALLTPDGDEQQQAVTLLRDRYPQYHSMPIDEQPVIAIRPQSVVAWGSLSDH